MQSREVGGAEGTPVAAIICGMSEGVIIDQGLHTDDEEECEGL